MGNKSDNKDVKKYYWLQLRKDFFKRHDIRIIEESGKDYILFYIKLLLESIDHDGYLRFSKTVPYNDKMLSVITNTDIDTVREAMAMFKEYGLIEIMEDKTILMTQTQSMLGQETEWAAKKRKYRENQKIQGTNNTKDEKDNDEDDVEKEEDIVLQTVEIKEVKVDYDELFNRFWKAYPRKVGKDKCQRWFKSHKVTDDFVDDLTTSITRQKKSIQWSKNDGQYIPHPYTWLNRGGWNDELEYAETVEVKITKRWENFIDEK